MYEGDTKEYRIDDEQESVNEIVEIKDEEANEEKSDAIPKQPQDNKEDNPKKKHKRKKISKIIKDFWSGLTKKQKIIAIVISSVVLLAVIITIIILVKPNNEKPEDVILEADNYRYENGRLFFLNSDNEEIGSYECNNKDEELCYVAYSSNEDNFDTPKDVYDDESEVLKRMRIINDNYVFIYDNKEKENGTITLYSIKENSSYESYSLVKEYNLDQEYVVAKDEHNNYGVLLFDDNSFKEVISFKYDYLGIIDLQKAIKSMVGVKNNKWYLIDLNEKEVTKAINEEIKSFNDAFVATANTDGSYHLFDYNGISKKEYDYNYISFFNDYVILIKNNLLSITDKELNPLFIDEIKLNSTNYNTINIYDKKTNKLIETKEAFGLSLNSNTLELKYNVDKTKLINVLESVVSKNYDYISYYDDKLYIYSDKEKTNLLGSYSCTNKNIINSENSTLDNCYIALSTSFADNDMNHNNTSAYIPIFNNRFVFIKDTPALTSAETMNIVLFDLKSNKSLGSYRSVDTLKYNQSEGITFEETTGSLIIAKNNKDYYGILKIKLGEIVSLDNIKFNDKNKSIEQIGIYFEIQKATGTYYLIDTNGQSVSSEFSSKIMNYKGNYLTVKSGSLYKVFTFNGEEISSKSFDYIELLNNGFVGISNNTLNIYKYANKDKAFTNDLSLNITDYASGKSYQVSESGTNYIVKIYNSNGSITEYNSALLGDANE